MQFHIDGQRHELALDIRNSLLDLLREHLDLTGTGACGACTVLVDGERISSRARVLPITLDKLL